MATNKYHSLADIEVDPVIDEGTDTDYASSGFVLRSPFATGENAKFKPHRYDTSTTSLKSSVNEYIFENGRRYHSYFGNDKNPMPTDETEQERLDIHHEVMLKLLDDELFKAPVSQLKHILDIGTGTGIWAIDAAQKYDVREAEVYVLC